jgi:phosphoglycerate dehydrogenase-like enzyme
MIAALRSGQLQGAALDVFEKEPLPVPSPLYQLPNLLLTPHISGVTSAYHARITDHFANNLQRYLAGERIVDLITE